MRWRVFLLASVAANLILAGGWFVSERREAKFHQRPMSALPLTQTKTNVIVRQQFFTWQELESNDYRTFIANLRGIGCPEQTIRDIIIADVNSVYARKRATEVVTSEQQWWRAEPDTNITAAATAKIRELEYERRALLTGLLGADWETGDQISLPRPTRTGLNLDGPVLGILPNDVKQTVQDINVRAQQRINDYLEMQQRAGKPVDPLELARLRQMTRGELAQVLTPPQVEEFLLRYSQNAVGLRSELSQLKYFNASPDEFRQAFRATDLIDQQLQLLAGATDVNSSRQRAALLEQRQNALKIALGPERYELYSRLHDPGYREAFAAAQKAGTPTAAVTLYEINQAMAEEQTRIRANTNLTSTQLAVELKKAELEQLKATAEALGQKLQPEPEPPAKTPPPHVHVLAPGENLTRLAQLYGVNLDALRAANPNLNPDKLKAGDSVNVPISLLPLVPVPTVPQP